jgi:hypothetical protein
MVLRLASLAMTHDTTLTVGKPTCDRSIGFSCLTLSYLYVVHHVKRFLRLFTMKKLNGIFI